MFFWYAFVIFFLIDIIVFLYIFKHRIQFPRASACRQGICGYWKLPKCSNSKVNLEDFAHRNGREESFSCSSVYLGFKSAEEHARYVYSSQFSNLILIFGFIISLLALEVSILINVHDKSMIRERIKILDNRIENLEKSEIK